MMGARTVMQEALFYSFSLEHNETQIDYEIRACLQAFLPLSADLRALSLAPTICGQINDILCYAR